MNNPLWPRQEQMPLAASFALPRIPSCSLYRCLGPWPEAGGVWPCPSVEVTASRTDVCERGLQQQRCILENLRALRVSPHGLELAHTLGGGSVTLRELVLKCFTDFSVDTPPDRSALASVMALLCAVLRSCGRPEIWGGGWSASGSFP